MGDRYYVTGVQLGMIKAILKDGDDVTNIIDNIIDKQFLCNSNGFKKLKRMFANVLRGEK